jgi:hypothetical protein
MPDSNSEVDATIAACLITGCPHCTRRSRSSTPGANVTSSPSVTNQVARSTSRNDAVCPPRCRRLLPRH